MQLNTSLRDSTQREKVVYQDLNFWRRIRRRILEHGESINHVSETTQISRNTIRKMLKHETPPPYIRGSVEKTPEAKRQEIPATESRQDQIKHEWMEWLYCLERNPADIDLDLPTPPDLLKQLSPSPHSPRKRALTILAKRKGFSIRAIGEHLGINCKTVKGYLTDFDAVGVTKLYEPNRRKRMSNDPALKGAVFALLHEPPSLSGYNRTTWRMDDLQETLRERGFSACKDVIRTVIKDAGFRWRTARVVLTSTDPDYREKLQHVQDILSGLTAVQNIFWTGLSYS
jgi:transposase